MRALGAAAVLLAFELLGCVPDHTIPSVTGAFHARDAPTPWTLEPNRCASTDPKGTLGADLYRSGVPGDDTEVVLLRDRAGYSVLARLPGRNELVRLRPADCPVFDVALRYTGWAFRKLEDYDFSRLSPKDLDPAVDIGDWARGVTGSARIDCQRPEIGRVVGEAKFTCY